MSLLQVNIVARQTWQHAGRLATLWRLSLILWVGLLIATPISLWIAGDETFPRMATLGVLAQVGATTLALASGWTLARLTWVLVIVLCGTLGIEALGAATGFPFGAYSYADTIPPQLAGVPLIIPAAWFMMLAPAWAVSDAILGRRLERRSGRYALLHAALAGLAFTAWDLYLDPQMVARGLWAWEVSGGYFGIPWANFLGWWLSATLLTLVTRPRQLPRRPFPRVSQQPCR